MFGKLKDMAGNAMVQRAVDQITPIMHEQMEKIKSFKTEQLYDNEFFDNMVAKPAWTAISASLGGLTKLYPPLEQKFSGIMRHVRDELVLANDGQITLVEDFQGKLPGVLMEGLSKEA